MKRQHYLLASLMIGALTASLSATAAGQPAMQAFLNGKLPAVAPGAEGSWLVVPAFPHLEFADPTYLTFVPGTDLLAVCGRQGTIHVFNNDPQTRHAQLFLDLSGTTQGWHDCGLLAVAFHPEYGKKESPNRAYLYVWRQFTKSPTSGPEPPERVAPGRFNRLSRFTVAADHLSADPASELVLIDQYDRHIFHNGGAMLFGPEGFLYFTNGDEGGMYDEEFHAAQKFSGGLFAGVFRIDVDCDPARSHPIRRHPISPDPRYPCFTGNYFIPNDNPFVDASGETLEEYWAIGLRNPDALSRDPATGEVWMSDVGQQLREEINLLKRGANYQWSYREGTIGGPQPPPTTIVGEEQPPVYDYPHASGNNSVVGGLVYRGQRWTEQLTGKYLFGDNGSGRIWALSRSEKQPPRIEYLTRMPPGQGWSGLSRFGVDRRGEPYLCMLGHPGAIYRLQYRDRRPEGRLPTAPRLLSQTGAFSDLDRLTPAPGLLPYTVNAPFWSDGAEKRRWIALPCQPSDTKDPDAGSPEPIKFAADQPWHFPAGTVFVKHFEFGTGDPARTRRLETRFLVHGANGGYYGLTYKWADDGSDAVRVDEAHEASLVIETAAGLRRRNWYFPSSHDCLTCHTASAEFVLGVNTAQLNGALGSQNTSDQNQLLRWSEAGMFHDPIRPAQLAQLPRAVPVTDSNATLGHRVQSYLEANCAMCHRPGAVRSQFDARFVRPLREKRLVGSPPTSPGPAPGALLVSAGAPKESILLDRLRRTDHLKMPPLARNVLDQDAIRLIEQWIQDLQK